ncbi:hypothetical protein C9374_010299 [Naegleria lovaniensis]|uniref:Importin subunit alpha n=1 Tax=Naegleria lovaniensis TaxID=51637 RepID=A0AA88GC88_NAELO|nr:uncharacterized protein C9374_010299 [Naegleria lovaniensis]KAG2374925.1 hypothetical protein C9374_010299 [Naegleria lovaniensis]
MTLGIRKKEHQNHRATLGMRILREKILSSVKQGRCSFSPKFNTTLTDLTRNDDGNSSSLLSSLFWNHDTKSTCATTGPIISENTRKLIVSETIVAKDDIDFKNKFGVLFKQYSYNTGHHQKIPYGTRRKTLNKTTVRDLPMLVTCLDMEWNSFQTVLNAATVIRKLLSIERNPPINEVIQSGAMEYFIQFLDFNEIQKYFNVEFQSSQIPKPFSQIYRHVPGQRTITERQLYDLLLESAWAVTNVASGTHDHTTYVVEMGAISKFIQLMPVENDEVRCQVIWGMGNIAGDSCSLRDLVLEMGAMSLLLHELDKPGNTLSFQRNATWALSNFLRGKPVPSFEYVKQCIPTICNLLDEKDEEVLTDACWAASYATDGPMERLQACVDQGFIPRLIKHVKSPYPSIQTPALRTIGNILTGDDTLTQAVLSANSGEVIYCLKSLLDHPKQSLRKEAMWTISNIAAGTISQIQQLIDAGVVPKIIEKLGDEYTVQKEGYWGLSNICDCGSRSQIEYVVKCGGVNQLVKGLNKLQDPKVTYAVMEGLEAVLRKYDKGDASQPITDILYIIEQEGGVEVLEKLEKHYSEDVSRLAQTLLDYFDQEGEENEDVQTVHNPSTNLA